MVVCICNAIREKDIRNAAQNGAQTPSTAYAKMGCRARCGQCVSFAREIIQSEIATA